MMEKQPKPTKLIVERADPVLLKKAIEEFRGAIRRDAETKRYAPPPVIPVEWQDAFPHLPR
ncbi:MAG: hypothetical protein A3C30_01465 [Candidatus Levybacteria bacterium RIFCSPHIGHO2_02_FULL_40_18]|nr:MAG: hypothetical protein A2869_01030 [Candidatus Levybacteria bacterium RIFCSPHIGHO2_01_FULL_40_58]OGH26665.1 MAG: hypothetical protein A3C30_01465 [Candidatus Levybacteria bacterium RIFCSPHIGHO2_02_FULL_40_18]OGH31194.1 MAG: hypothetical protein A3E43_00300 [Candidatus Levybacteria bacterium RIFCSPHIGHO2_12_FULL_40_31]OGH39876.1 MAG: hypothetical protein A2894_03805 [Candidatus Levybacteria bacterium RIFCSPLOWO2_01_FULL_40_64]OGH48900.1 MAG: hypothetical protein A3I54_04910 [Candidatus Lev